ncbi:hypothetical protein GCM10009665_20710 [Kitasatospora nipponensis]|uniref:Uncharacterized protein n=1 Tax=Kitasatospora nipponensis TaxID=258049 RepID=A0ABN1W3V4_9ACTN
MVDQGGEPLAGHGGEVGRRRVGGDQHQPAGPGERGQRDARGLALQLVAQPAEFAAGGDGVVHPGRQLVGVRSHRDAQDQVAGRQRPAGAVDRGLRVAALQQPRQQGLPGDLLVAQRRLPLLDVPGRDRAAHQSEVLEQPVLHQQDVGQVTGRGRREDPGRALLRAEVVGPHDGLQRDALVRAPGRGLADPGQFVRVGRLAGAQHHGEGPDAAVHLPGDLAAQLFGGERLVGGQRRDETGHHRGCQRRRGGPEPFVDGDAAEPRCRVAFGRVGRGHNPPRESLWCGPGTPRRTAAIMFSGTLLTSW